MSSAAPYDSARPDTSGLYGELPTHEREGQLFWRLRVQIGRAHLRYLFSHARLRTSLVIGLSLFFWFGLFALFFKGFEFVIRFVVSQG
jgi:hypothetical protein